MIGIIGWGFIFLATLVLATFIDMKYRGIFTVIFTKSNGTPFWKRVKNRNNYLHIKQFLKDNDFIQSSQSFWRRDLSETHIRVILDEEPVFNCVKVFTALKNECVYDEKFYTYDEFIDNILYASNLDPYEV